MVHDVAITVRGPRRFGELSDIEFDIYDFSGGVNIKKTPQQLSDNELVSAVNVYLRSEGGVEMRKGMTPRGTLLGAGLGQGLAYLYQQTKNGAPQSTPPTYLIGVVGTSVYNVDTGALVGMVSAGSQAPQFVKVYDPQHAGGASDILVFTTGVGGPYAFDGVSVYTLPLSNPAAAVDARWCALVNGVLWFGGMKAQPNLVVGTVIGQPETDPFYQQFAMSQPVTGLGTLGAGAQAALVVGATHGVAAIYGVGPGNFVLQDFPATDGVAAGRTVLTIDGIVYFLGARAVYRFDGQTITAISTPVEPWILNDPLTQDYPMSGNRALAWAFEYNQRLHIVYDRGPGYANTMLVFDLLVGGWTVIDGPTLSGAAYLDAPSDARPLNIVVMDSTKGQAYLWDQYNGQGSTGHNVTDAGAIIATSVQTKYFKIGMPGTRKKMRRAYPEMFTEVFTGTFTVTTDYGQSAGSGASTAVTASTFTWDQSLWDQALWSATGLGFFKNRIDFNVAGEAFAFSVSSADTNPPWRFVGLSGVFVQEARN